MKNNSIKKISKYINDNSKSKTLLFFGFYFVFFFFLIISLRNNNASDVIENSKYLFSIEALKSNNYHFKYTLNIDGVNTIYEGDLNNNKQLFTINNVDKYYEESNTYFKYNNGWVSATNPYQVIVPRYQEVLEKLLDNATYISKTENVDKTNIYTYQISTTTLYKLFDLVDLDLDDIPNEIKVYTDSDNNLIKLEMDFSSYYRVKKMCINKLVILMEYSNYGSISDLSKEY